MSRPHRASTDALSKSLIEYYSTFTDQALRQEYKRLTGNAASAMDRESLMNAVVHTSRSAMSSAGSGSAESADGQRHGNSSSSSSGGSASSGSSAAAAGVKAEQVQQLQSKDRAAASQPAAAAEVKNKPEPAAAAAKPEKQDKEDREKGEDYDDDDAMDEDSESDYDDKPTSKKGKGKRKNKTSGAGAKSTPGSSATGKRGRKRKPDTAGIADDGSKQAKTEGVKSEGSQALVPSMPLPGALFFLLVSQVSSVLIARSARRSLTARYPIFMCAIRQFVFRSAGSLALSILVINQPKYCCSDLSWFSIAVIL